jgi:hypothetical protein
MLVLETTTLVLEVVELVLELELELVVLGFGQRLVSIKACIVWFRSPEQRVPEHNLRFGTSPSHWQRPVQVSRSA